MQPDLLTKRINASVSERCVIVCVHVGDGISLEEGIVVRDALNGLDTDGWWFFNPATFIVAFRSSRSGKARASVCEAALARLREGRSSLAPLTFASAEGPVLTAIAEGGYLDTPPLGNVVNEASWKARRNAG